VAPAHPAVCHTRFPGRGTLVRKTPSTGNSTIGADSRTEDVLRSKSWQCNCHWPVAAPWLRLTERQCEIGAHWQKNSTSWRAHAYELA